METTDERGHEGGRGHCGYVAWTRGGLGQPLVDRNKGFRGEQAENYYYIYFLHLTMHTEY